MEEKKRKTWLKVAIGILVVLLAGVIAAGVYLRHMVGLVRSAEENTVATMSQEELEALMGTTEETQETSPENTWPQVVSDQNITNIMLVGHNYREDEPNMLADTMILCSVNRQDKTMRMVSFMRDLYVPLPAYAGHSGGRNRINVCYALGSQWKRSSLGGMEMLAKCIEQNFGVHVDHTIEVSFDTFISIIDTLGGVEVDLTEKEAEYLTQKVGYVGEMHAGKQVLAGNEALAYARIRKIDSDRQRAARQRSVITSVIDQCRSMGLLELHDLAEKVLPMIVTDMTTDEMTNYLWEFIPMVKDLKLESLTIPVDNETLPQSAWGKTIELYGYQSSVLECNLKTNGEYLRNFLGIVPEES